MPTESIVLSEYYGTIKSIARELAGITVVCSEEDLIQEGFLILIRSLGTYDPSLGDLKPYLRYKIRYGLIDAVRGQTKDTQWGVKEKISLENVNEDLLAEPDSRNVEEQVIRRENIWRVRHSLEKLPERERNIMVDRFYELLPVQVLAKKYSLSNGRISQVIKKSLSEMKLSF